MIGHRLRSVAVGIVFATAIACGKKGPPLAPLRLVPAAVESLSIERAGAAVALHFTLPDVNTDGSTPVALLRVDIFAVSLPAEAPPPTPAQFLLPDHLVTSIAVRPTEMPQAVVPADVGPRPGDVVHFVETLSAARLEAPSSLVRHYVVVPSSGRRLGPLSPILRVPLTSDPRSPAGLRADYTEATATLRWQPVAVGLRYVVEETDNAFARAKRLTPEPIDAASWDFPVQFGQVRCFFVRAVDRRDAVTLVGEPSAPVCVTPVDRFAPPAPTGLVAVPVDGAIELIWTASAAPDVAGYIVLRGDDANGTLQRLTLAPVSATTYRDLTARSGTTYVYAVVAIDKATPPNQSGESNRQSVTAR